MYHLTTHWFKILPKLTSSVKNFLLFQLAATQTIILFHSSNYQYFQKADEGGNAKKNKINRWVWGYRALNENERLKALNIHIL